MVPRPRAQRAVCRRWQARRCWALSTRLYDTQYQVNQAIKNQAIKPLAASLGALTLLALAGCAGAAAPIAGKLKVVAGENFWGSIAIQLGGSHVAVTSIVTNPGQDPHEFETSPADARLFATANYVILNGAGYDDWGNRLLAANPTEGRRLFSVATLLGKKAGDNPHFWYNPDWVEQVADRITADYQALDPDNGGDYGQQREAFRQTLKPYHERIARIRANHSGVPVGATESIFVYQAAALGLRLVSPPAFMQATSEATDPPAQSVAQFHDQLTEHQVKLLVYNNQTSSAITDNLKQLATSNHVPVVGVSETIEPNGTRFQDWQLKQLDALEQALSRP
jgi:zinc/manganese transport system substrate-binding protein